MKLLDVYDDERTCEYKGELYSVRDNGAVMRHAREGEKPRKLDNVWTFGTVDKKKGYLRFSAEAVHRIVATAYHGPAPSDQHIVDHKDTNRQNNRPDNLRWITKLDNLILNDITRRKLELACGCSIEEILKDLSILHNKNLSPDVAWMKTVSAEEAAESLKAWQQWAKESSEKKLSRKGADSGDERERRNTERKERPQRTFLPNPAYGRTSNEMQYPLEPKETEPSLESYCDNLKLKATLCYKNFYGEIASYRITDFFLNKETSTLTVATELEEGLKKYYLTDITIIDEGYNYEVRSFFQKNGQDKYMTLARGEEWTGGEVMDDYC